MTLALLALAANVAAYFIHRSAERAALDAALLRGEVLIA